MVEKVNLKGPKKNKEENENLPQTHAIDIVIIIEGNTQNLFLFFMYL